jgi:hypothetical protein
MIFSQSEADAGIVQTYQECCIALESSISFNVRHVILEFLRKRSADFQVFSLVYSTVMSSQEKSTVHHMIW